MLKYQLHLLKNDTLHQMLVSELSSNLSLRLTGINATKLFMTVNYEISKQAIAFKRLNTFLYIKTDLAYYEFS